MRPPHLARGLRRVAGTVGLVTLAVLAAPGAGQASRLSLWAERSINISGNDNLFYGLAHSNGTVDITGNGNTVSGPVGYLPKRDGSIGFRTHGRKASLRPTQSHAIRVTIRLGEQCSQGSTTLRAKNAGRLFP